MPVDWQDRSDNHGLAPDDDRLLVVGTGDHDEWIMSIQITPDTYNGPQ